MHDGVALSVTKSAPALIARHCSTVAFCVIKLRADLDASAAEWAAVEDLWSGWPVWVWAVLLVLEGAVVEPDDAWWGLHVRGKWGYEKKEVVAVIREAMGK